MLLSYLWHIFSGRYSNYSSITIVVEYYLLYCRGAMDTSSAFFLKNTCSDNDLRGVAKSIVQTFVE